ncbi:hypothetical protein A2V71_04750 [Candidatus Berkelbacteria bacterium RBG_13_40_8]|uniref:Uncharacterized protein n=1 Tax=Candidatus Berkelbacteria bacterium RBG_13_40_8 TaxID=1797467 RepID=A0A1F5DMY9_9BACT|nr:MAG: hypothetical protein A2V71_04750 [Candidatus Berkelbacteria bacterium RBG_13_40_8]
MSEGEPKDGFTPDQLEMEKSRTVSDADFIKGGAEYKDINGQKVLEPTSKQIEKITSDNEINDTISALESNANSKNDLAFLQVFLKAHPAQASLESKTMDNILNSIQDAFENNYIEDKVWRLVSESLRNALIQELREAQRQKQPDMKLVDFLQSRVISEGGYRSYDLFPKNKKD